MEIPPDPALHRHTTNDQMWDCGAHVNFDNEDDDDDDENSMAENDPDMGMEDTDFPQEGTVVRNLNYLANNFTECDILAWNIKGAGNKRTPRGFKNLVSCHRVNIATIF